MVDKRLMHTIRSMGEEIVDKCAGVLNDEEDIKVALDDIRETIAELVEVVK